MKVNLHMKTKLRLLGQPAGSSAAANDAIAALLGKGCNEARAHATAVFQRGNIPNHPLDPPLHLLLADAPPVHFLLSVTQSSLLRLRTRPDPPDTISPVVLAAVITMEAAAPTPRRYIQRL
jgi:hypothetical protein